MANYTEVFVWGDNRSGQLGLGTEEKRQWHEVPKHCSFNIALRHVSCGDSFTALLSSSGHVYTMGSNRQGRLGLGRPQLTHAASPCLVEGLRDVKGLACGAGHTLVYTETGRVFGWGWNAYGALGTGDLEDRFEAAHVAVQTNFTVKAVYCGGKCSVLLGSSGREEGVVLGCGAEEVLGVNRRNACTMLALEHAEPVKNVSLGWSHSAFVTVLGRVYTAGDNTSGQLGTGTTSPSSSPVLVSELEGVSIQQVHCSLYTVALTSSGQLYCWGPSPFGLFLTPQKLPSLPRPLLAVDIAADYGVGLDIAGQVWVWGEGREGRLGLGDCEARKAAFPVKELMETVVRTVVCGDGFVVALGRDVAALTRKRSSGLHTARVRKTDCSPIRVDSIESTRSTARMKPALDSEPAASSRRDTSGSATLRLLLESHVSQLSSEVRSLELRLSETSQALASERQARQQLESQLQAFRSLPTSLESSQAVHEKRMQELTLKCDNLAAELQAIKATSQSPISSLQHTIEVSQLSDSTEPANPQMQRLQRDFARVQDALERAESHNRELLEELDRRSVKKARDYKERSLCMLKSPSPMKMRPALSDYDSNKPPTFREPETGCRPLDDSCDSLSSGLSCFRRDRTRACD